MVEMGRLTFVTRPLMADTCLLNGRDGFIYLCDKTIDGRYMST